MIIIFLYYVSKTLLPLLLIHMHSISDYFNFKLTAYPCIIITITEKGGFILKKYFALILLFSVLTHSYFVGMIDSKTDNPLFIQETETISSFTSGEIHPADGDLKQKGPHVIHELFVTLILIVTFFFHHFIQFIMRRTILCPVLFQSNYLITSP
jgi:hypothetical protein